MIEGLPSLGPVGRPAATARTAAARATVPVAGPPDLSLPATPPAAVLEALGAAQDVLKSLDTRELRFSISQDDGKVHVKVVDGEGSVLREIPAKHALDVLVGETTIGLGVDAVG